MFLIALSARELQLAQLILHVLVYILLEFIAAHSLAAMLFLAGLKHEVVQDLKQPRAAYIPVKASNMSLKSLSEP